MAIAPGVLRCPKCGAASTDPEFCSDCGAAMAAPLPAPPASASPPPPDPPAAGAPDACPVCGEPRPGPFARFCDNCRYDFLARQPFGAAPVAVAAAPPPPDPARPALITPPPVLVPQSPAAARWDLHATVDPSLRRPDDPMPTDTRARIFPLDLSDHLIGRRSDSEDIHPEVPVADPGISRRHARILRAADGALSLLDLGSTNGTRLNGTPVEPNLPTPLANGDAVTLGCWTRLTVTAR